MRQEDQFQTSFCFLKKALNDVKASVQNLSFNMFDSPKPGHTNKQTA